MPIFVPKDQHCGIWHSPPNKSCSSSFGDQGTTASTNCFGDIIQLTQYLGAGHSGLFSMDQLFTAEPYLVHGRAKDLEALVKDMGPNLTYDLVIPPEFFPQEPLNVKWVNWRWPRYEYDTGVPQVKAFIQWVVRDGIVLKQFVLENRSHEDVDFQFCFESRMWIRDLDYLDEAYHFNDSDNGYYYEPGPNGFGFVRIHTWETPTKVDTSGDEQTPLDVPQNLRRSATGDFGQGPAKDPEPTPASDSQTVQPGPGSPEQPMFNPLKNAQPPSRMTTEQEKPKAEGSKETGPQTNNSHAVASVITIFVNGKAIQTPGNPNFRSQTFTLAGKDAETVDPHGSTLEVVVAYKMILLPDAPVDWRNFLVPAQKAQVNVILQRETDCLWETAESSSLLSIGLSLVDVNSDVRDMASKASNTESTNDSSHERADQGHKDNNSNPGSAAPNESETTTTSGGNPHRFRNWETPSAPKTKATEFPTGTPGKASSRNHIEYLVWRHLEHILSVCAVPLSIPALFEGARSPSSSSPAELPKFAVDAPVALTCGDMAGHRICNSASL